jgi:hypothetical protein
VGEFQLSYGKLGPTEVRVLAILLNLFMYFKGANPAGLTWNLFGKVTLTIYDVIVLFVAVMLGTFFFTSWLKQMHQLGEIEPPRKAAPQS